MPAFFVTRFLLLVLVSTAAAATMVVPYELGWQNTSTLAFSITNNGTTALASVGSNATTGTLELFSANGTIALRSDTESIVLVLRGGCIYLNETVLGCSYATPAVQQQRQDNGSSSSSFETLKTGMIAAGVGSLGMIVGCVVGMFAMKKRMQTTSYHTVEEIKQ